MSLAKAEFDIVKAQVFSEDCIKQLLESQESKVFVPLYSRKRSKVERPHSFKIIKSALADQNTLFKLHFKLHCYLVGGEQKNPHQAVVTVQFKGEEWNAKCVFDSLVWKSFEEAEESCKQVRFGYCFEYLRVSHGCPTFLVYYVLPTCFLGEGSQGG